MFKGKKGFNIGGLVNTAITAIIGITVLLLLYANLVPTAQTAGQNLTDSGLPLGSLFGSSGLIFILVMVGLLLLAVKMFVPSGKK